LLRSGRTRLRPARYDFFTSSGSEFGAGRTAAAAGLANELPARNAVVGLRKHLVDDYMNIDMARALELVQLGRHEFVTAFLLADPPVG